MRDIKLALTSVNKDILSLFKESAKELIKELGNEEALERALAYISGYTKVLFIIEIIIKIIFFLKLGKSSQTKILDNKFRRIYYLHNLGGKFQRYLNFHSRINRKRFL